MGIEEIGQGLFRYSLTLRRNICELHLASPSARFRLIDVVLVLTSSRNIIVLHIIRGNRTVPIRNYIVVPFLPLHSLCHIIITNRTTFALLDHSAHRPYLHCTSDLRRRLTRRIRLKKS